MLHDFKIISSDNRGLVERCTRCGMKMHFPENTPNHKYMEYHVRQALQTSDPRYYVEYKR